MGAGIRAALDDEKRKDGQQTTNNDTSGRRSGFAYHVEEKERNTGAPKRTICWLHVAEGEAGDHPIWRCKSFLRKNTRERQEAVRENKACFRCLLTTFPGAADVGSAIEIFTAQSMVARGCIIACCMSMLMPILQLESRSVPISPRVVPR